MSGSVDRAAAYGDVVVLTVPWFALPATIRRAGNLEGKILLDCTNPIGRAGSEHGVDLDVGFSDSGAEQLARYVPEAVVVKALNMISAQTIRHCAAAASAEPATTFVCGDRAHEKRIVFELLQDLGLMPLDVGPLVKARYLEPLAMLLRDLDDGTPNLDLRVMIGFDDRRGYERAVRRAATAVRR